MDNLLKELEELGCEVKVGWKEKERKKTIIDSLRKLKEDDVKNNYAKKLYRYYCTLNSLGYILNPTDIPIEEDKYGIHYLCHYLDCFIDTSKMSIVAVIKALGNDESLDPFCKSLMLRHMYSPEELV